MKQPRKVKDAEVAEQTTFLLPYFNEQLPLLVTPDGGKYVPVVALCELLGLHADNYIPRWRQLMVWEDARKLPWRPAPQDIRVVWCLQRAAIPSLLFCFDWGNANPAQRPKMQAFTRAYMQATSQVYQLLVHDYHLFRRQVFDTLTTCDALKNQLMTIMRRAHTALADNEQQQLTTLVDAGGATIEAVTLFARNKAQEMAQDPIIDAKRVDGSGQVVDTMPLPMIPEVTQSDHEQLLVLIERLGAWYTDFKHFLEEHHLQ